MHKEVRTARHMIEHAKKIALFGHMSPDGDCIGAMLGLGRLLEKQKKQVSYFVPNKPSKVFDFIKNIKRLKSNFDYKNYDLLIFVDFTGLNRMGIISQAKPSYFEKKPIVVFDHHPGNGLDHGVVIKDVESISTCEILFEQTHKRRPELYDKEIATYFYLGITSDSGNFLFEKDHIRTFTNILKLLTLDADKDLIVNNLFRKRSINAVKFLQLLLNRINQRKDLLYTYYNEDELKEYDIDQEEAAYGLHIIQNIDGPEIVLFIRKIGDFIKCSIRTKTIDGNKIAQSFGGGGHRLAAGFVIPAKGRFETQIEEIVKHINKMTKQ